MFSAATKTDNVSSSANYVEDVFSTYLYTGTGAAQTITNGIDLSTKGGLVWVKSRSAGYLSHVLADTVRGNTKVIYSNLTAPQDTFSTGISSFNSNGFSIGSSDYYNESAGRFVSWTFREQAKFFDVVTWTGNGVAGRQIPHNLGSVPGCIIVKNLELGTDWIVYHRGADVTAPQDYEFYLNATNARIPSGLAWNNTAPTATNFTVGSGNEVNRASSLNTYVAYLFAHNAGGFGLTGTDNVISCGSFTDNGAIQSISLGYEPQWVLAKRTNITGDWWLVDNMRGMPVGSVDATLKPNAADAEQNVYEFINPEATGFRWQSGSISSSGQTWIYIAIRRGPMKTPTSGTSVFAPVAYTGAGAGTTYTTNFPVDMTLVKSRNLTSEQEAWDRLRGSSKYLLTTAADAEATFGGPAQWQVDRMTSVLWNAGDGYSNTSPNTYGTWNFRRAPGFFDEVCYTGTGSATTQAHNLGVAPELMIVKSRSNSGQFWATYSATTGSNKFLQLNATDAAGTLSSVWNNTAPTSSVFTVGTRDETNGSGFTYVAYLFATCAGVSKVGSYTGTGALQTVNCGFAAGARFVLIKRTDSTGDWYVWDSARGISSGNDPYLLWNSTAAEVTGTNYVDTTAVGFQVTAAAPAALNASGGTYIFLAVA